MHYKAFFMVVIAAGVILASCQSEELVFGIISDTHGNHENTAYFVNEFKEHNVDAVLVAGDIADHFRNDIDDYTETKKVFEEFVKADVPILIIPGNHDNKADYYRAINEVKSNNLIDLSKTRTYDLGKISVISLPGYNDKSFEPENGFLFNDEDIKNLGKLRNTLEDKVILLSHLPPKGKNNGSIDVIFDGKNVGSGLLSRVMEESNIDFSVTGHIHESGGRAVNEKDELIPENEFSSTLRFNPGSAARWKFLNGTEYNGIAGILTFKNGLMKYEVLAIS